jgi:hypothetical protein
MKTNATLKITLPAENIELAIAEWTKKRNIFNETDDVKVELCVKSETRGYGQGEHTVHYVEAVATVERKL